MARGLDEPYEKVFIVKGFTLEGHLHAPLIYQDRFFKPFTRHVDPQAEPHITTVQVMLDDPANPYESGELAAYPGIIKNYDNVARVKRPSTNSAQASKPKWILRTLILSLYDAASKTTSDLTLTDVLAWRSGDPAGSQPTQTVPFCVKAIELTSKEIADLKDKSSRHERIPL